MTFERDGVITGLWEEVVAEHGDDLTGHRVTIRTESSGATTIEAAAKRRQEFLEVVRDINDRAIARGGHDPGIITRDMIYAMDEAEAQSGEHRPES